MSSGHGRELAAACAGSSSRAGTRATATATVMGALGAGRLLLGRARRGGSGRPGSGGGRARWGLVRGSSGSRELVIPAHKAAGQAGSGA